MEIWFALKLYPCATSGEQISSPFYWAACSLVTVFSMTNVDHAPHIYQADL